MTTSTKRFRLIVLGPLATLALLVGGCNSQPKVSDGPIRELSPSQRSRGASDAILGSIGFKRFDGGTWFERQRLPDWKSVSVHTASVVTSSKFIETRLGELGVAAGALAEAKTKAGWSTTDQLKLTTLQITDPSKLADEIEVLINSDARLKSILSLENIRIVTSVTTVLDAKSTSQIEASLTAKGVASKLTGSENLNVSFDIGGNRKYEVKIGDGTTVLYRFSRLCWTPDRRLVTLRVDGEGTDTCPSGTNDRLPN